MRSVWRVEFWLPRLGSHYIAEWVSDHWEFFVREWGSSQWMPVPPRPELIEHADAEEILALGCLAACQN